MRAEAVAHQSRARRDLSRKLCLHALAGSPVGSSCGHVRVELTQGCHGRRQGIAAQCRGCHGTSKPGSAFRVSIACLVDAMHRHCHDGQALRSGGALRAVHVWRFDKQGCALLATRRTGVAGTKPPSTMPSAPTSMGSPSGVPVPCTATAATFPASSAQPLMACRTTAYAGGGALLSRTQDHTLRSRWKPLQHGMRVVTGPSCLLGRSIGRGEAAGAAILVHGGAEEQRQCS